MPLFEYQTKVLTLFEEYSSEAKIDVDGEEIPINFAESVNSALNEYGREAWEVYQIERIILNLPGHPRDNGYAVRMKRELGLVGVKYDKH